MVNGGAQPVRRQLRCDGCGDVIGVYERLLVERDDGTRYSSSLLKLDEHEGVRGARVWHARCVVA